MRSQWARFLRRSRHFVTFCKKVVDPYCRTRQRETANNLSRFVGSSDTSDFDLTTGNACTGSRTIGADPVHAVDLVAGQVLTVAARSTEATPEDLAVYMVSGCVDVEAQCLVGADLQGATATAEALTYTATKDETVFIVVDSFFATSVGGYELSVTVN